MSKRTLGNVLIWAVAAPLLVVTLVLSFVAWGQADAGMWAAAVLPAAVLCIVVANVGRLVRLKA